MRFKAGWWLKKMKIMIMIMRMIMMMMKMCGYDICVRLTIWIKEKKKQGIRQGMGMAYRGICWMDGGKKEKREKKKGFQWTVTFLTLYLLYWHKSCKPHTPPQ